MADPFVISIFVPEGDPEGLRIIERQTSPNKFFCFPRDKWEIVKKRSELTGAGVYVLVGYANPNDELPTVYVGQADNVCNRINQHIKGKDFWDRAIIFTSEKNKLNSADVKWLEYELIKRVNEVKRSKVENGNTPNEPTISESSKASLKVFLTEIYQTLPLVGLLAFEKPRVITDNKGIKSTNDNVKNTIVVPARPDGFKRVFIGENAWWAVRIAGGMLNKIKYIAAYQVAPISAITHYAEVASIESIGEEGKYRLNFTSPAQKLATEIPLGKVSAGSMQGPRYTSFKKLMNAKTVADL